MGRRGYSTGTFLKVGAYLRTYGRFCITKLFAWSLWESPCRLFHDNFSFRVAIVITDGLMFPQKTHQLKVKSCGALISAGVGQVITG